MSGLVEFLLARLSDDEQAIDHASMGDAWMDEGSVPFHPNRMRADIAAKRQVIEIADGYEAGWPATDNDADWDMEQILQALAVPYSDHPDYRQWKP